MIQEALFLQGRLFPQSKRRRQPVRGRKPIEGLSAITLPFSSPRTETTPGIYNKPPGIPPLTPSPRDARVWGWGGEGSAFAGTDGHLQGPSRPLRNRERGDTAQDSTCASISYLQQAETMLTTMTLFLESAYLKDAYLGEKRERERFSYCFQGKSSFVRWTEKSQCSSRWAR